MSLCQPGSPAAPVESRAQFVEARRQGAGGGTRSTNGGDRLISPSPSTVLDAAGAATPPGARDGSHPTANTNGPAVAVLDGAMTLIIGDTSAHYYAYPYDPHTGTVGERRVFGDMTDLAGYPDGSTIDRDDGLWCALYNGAQLARFTTTGLDQTLALPVQNPTDVTFGGPDLDSLYVVSTSGNDELGGALLRIDGLQHQGRIEPRFAAAT